MKHYTIGALFNKDLTEVLLILKTHPDWQKGKYNLPGGHMESGEGSIGCVMREFSEECSVTTLPSDWKLVGQIKNPDNYDVDIFTAIYEPNIHGEIKTMTDEEIMWFPINQLPENIIVNLSWIIPFCKEFYGGNSADILQYGEFKYKY